MSTKYQVIIRSSQLNELDTVAVPQGAGNQGAPVRIKAVTGQRYQLIDTAKAEGMAPDWVRVKRSGKNLLVFFEDSLEADLVIENYYEVMPEGYNAVVGQAEVGGLYEYFPEDPDTYGLVPNLVDGAATSTNVVLGGAEIAGFELAGLPLIAAFPWGLAAAGAAGAAALAGGGGESGGGSGGEPGGGGGGGGEPGGGADDPDAPGEAQKLVISVLDGQNDINKRLDKAFVNNSEFFGSGNEGAEKPGVQLGIKLPTGTVAGSQLVITLIGGGKTQTLEHTVTAEEALAGSFGLDLSKDLFGGDNPSEGEYIVQTRILAPGADASSAVVSEAIPFTVDTIVGDGRVVIVERPGPLVCFDVEATTPLVLFLIPNDTDVISATIKFVDDDNHEQTLELTKGQDGWSAVDLPEHFKLDAKHGQLYFPLSNIEKGSIPTITVLDLAGNVSKSSLVEAEWADLAADAVKPVMQLWVPEADDGWINAAELEDGVQVQVSIPSGTIAGDKVVIELKNAADETIFTGSKTLTADDLTRQGQKWVAFVVPKVKFPSDAQYTITAKLEDAGGVCLESTYPITFDLDTISPNTVPSEDLNDFTKMTLSILEAKDGYVNQVELSDGVQTTVGLPTDAKAGDTVTIYIRNETGELQGTATRELKSGDIDKKLVDFDLDKNSFSPDGKYKVEATIKDPAGNESKPLSKEFIVDTQAPGSTQDAGKLEIQVLDPSITPQEFERDNGVLVKVKLPTDVDVGDKLTLNVQHKIIPGANGSLDLVITQEHLDTLASDGGLLITLPMETFFKTEGARTDIPYDANYGTYIVSGVIADVAGNKLFSDEERSFTLWHREEFNYSGKADPTAERILSGVDYFVVGDMGNNKITAGAGNDWIFGGAGNDTINAGAGNDIIIGGSGRNTLTGGGGSDTFLYNQSSRGAIDTITDFTFGKASQEKDVLKLKDLFTNNQGNNLSSYIDFDVITAGDGKTVQLKIHTDGNKLTPADIQISLINQSNAFDWSLQQMIDNGNIVVE